MKNINKVLTILKWLLIAWPKMYLPNLSAQAKKFGILMKLGVCIQ